MLKDRFAEHGLVFIGVSPHQTPQGLMAILTFQQVSTKQQVKVAVAPQIKTCPREEKAESPSEKDNGKKLLEAR